MEFPKVLIIGQYFENRSGGGITLSNLFNGWPRDNLAVISENFRNPDFSICGQYYQLGNKEIANRFPFNYLFKSTRLKSGPLAIANPSSSNNSSIPIKASIHLKIKNHLLFASGQIHRMNKYKLSHQLSSWIKEYKPDVIYSQLSTLELIRFVSQISDLYDAKIAIHMMDDWPETITSSQSGIFRIFWSQIIKRELRNLLKKTSIFLSISDAMSDAYQTRYGYTFISFHNPVDTEKWLPSSKSDWRANHPFRLLYAGRLGTANNKSIKIIASAVNDLNSNDYKVKLEIYTPDTESELANLLRAQKGVEVNPSVHHQEMPALLSSHDLLILPLDFDKAGIKFAQYSMPTKTSEYLISGTPILVIADSKTALSEYAKNKEWGYVLNKCKKNDIINAIVRLSCDEALRKFFGERAINTAMINENAIIVRQNFRKSLGCSF